jgi:hypothetical protein
MNSKKHGNQKIDYDYVKKRHDSGETVAEIARDLGVNVNGVRVGMRKRFGKSRHGNMSSSFSNKQEEILFGSLLGDGYLNFRFKNKIEGNIRFIEEHCEKQFEYLKYKSLILNDKLSKKGITIRDRVDFRFKKENYKIATLRTKANPDLKKFHSLFYEDLKKIVPKNLSLLTPLALAIWFMDDGTKETSGYSLSTNAFDRCDVLRLSEFLDKKYGIKSNVNAANKIYIKAISKNDFTCLIKEFIVETMAYKLH